MSNRIVITSVFIRVSPELNLYLKINLYLVKINATPKIAIAVPMMAR